MNDVIDVLPAVNTWNDESGGHRPKNQWKQRLGITLPPGKLEFVELCLRNRGRKSSELKN